MSLSAFVNKPSDGVFFFILLCCTLLMLYVFSRASKHSDAAGFEEVEGTNEEEEEETETEEDAAERVIDPGIMYVGKGYLVVVGLIVAGVVLLTWFQALYPGR